MRYRYKILTETGKELVLSEKSEYLAKKTVANYNKHNAKQGLRAAYLGPDGLENTLPSNATGGQRKVLRSSVKFDTPRRTAKGIEVSAVFEARKSTQGKGTYRVRLIVDPANKGLLDHDIQILNRSSRSLSRQSHRAEQDTFYKRTNRELAKEVRDIFVQQATWFTLVASSSSR